MQFGKYRLLEKIGQGGMAEVFYAHIVGREGFTKEVALKRVLPHLCEDTDFVKSFVDEARLGGLLNHHHIVQTLDFGAERGIYYIAMEYVHGLTLRELMSYHKRKHAEIPPPVVLDIVIQLCDGLRYAHHAEDETGRPINMVHRDLKPTNILLSSHGVVKIADFGIARAETNSRRTAFGVVLKGTAQYMSPEQAYGELHLDRRSDIFSLGSITYELVTMTPLFYDRNSSVQTLRNVQDAKVDPALSAMVRQWPFSRQLYPILKRMLARDPEQRPSDIAEIIPQLRQFHLSLAPMIDLQSWMESILLDLGRPVKGRRSTTHLNIPVGAGNVAQVGHDVVQASGVSDPGAERQPPSHSPPTVAEPPPDIASIDDKTPVAQLKHIPGQPLLHENREPASSRDPLDTSVTQLALPDPTTDGDPSATRKGIEALATSNVTQPDGRVEDVVGPVPTMTDPLTPTQMEPGAGGASPREKLPFSSGALNEDALPELQVGVYPVEESGQVPPGRPALDGERAAGGGAGGADNAPVPLAWASGGGDSAQPREGGFLEKTPGWVDAGTSAPSMDLAEVPGAEEHESSNTGETLSKRSPATRRLLLVAGGGAVFAVCLLIVASVVLTPNSSRTTALSRVTIDSVPGGADVVFKDTSIPGGRTPLTRELEEGRACIDVVIRRDGYRTVERCLSIAEGGVVEPVELQPASKAAGVIYYYPLDLEGLAITVDGWAVDLRQRISRPNNQGSVRTYVSPRRHRVSVKTASCGEVAADFDFSRTTIYRFIKIVRSPGDPCKVVFAAENE